MDPLSRKKRITYFIFFSIVFFAVVPLFIFYAQGYRFNLKDVVKVSETGGLYVSTDQSGIEIYVNNVLEKKTSIIQKTVFVQDLRPGTYDIRVSKNGLQTWSKRLKVFPELVTEARTFLIKDHPELVSIPLYLSQATSTGSSVATTTKKAVKNPEYMLALKAFMTPLSTAPTTTKKVASTTDEFLPVQKLVFENTHGVLIATWKGEQDAIPSYFCENTVCKSSIEVKAGGPVLAYDLFPGRDDLLIVQLAKGVYVVEIDDRSPQNKETIVEGEGYEFRIKESGVLYLKHGVDIYSVAL